ncbi:MAG: hypothetical protein KGS72_23510 [Cyanobacteria bacterium REEB67]|nr:hypothetical protein [Cyanobacteria bacterium REEB67]
MDTDVEAVVDFAVDFAVDADVVVAVMVASAARAPCGHVAIDSARGIAAASENVATFASEKCHRAALFPWIIALSSLANKYCSTHLVICPGAEANIQKIVSFLPVVKKRNSPGFKIYQASIATFW